MKKLKLFSVFLMVALLATPVIAAPPGTNVHGNYIITVGNKPFMPPKHTVATLPTLTTDDAGALAQVTDGADAEDTTVGGGTDWVLARWTGSAWANAGDGQAAGSAEVADATIGAAGNGDTSHAYSKDDVHDYLAQHDSDFDGLPDGVENSSITDAMLNLTTPAIGTPTGSGASLTGVLHDLVDDTTPQLGGDLDLNAHVITGMVIDTDIQRYDAELAAIAGLTSAADKAPYFTGSGTADVMTVTSFARSILDDADEATFKATVNLEPGTDIQAYNASLAAIAAGTWTGASSITTLGTIATGTWHGDAIGTTYAGTDLDASNLGATLTFADGDFIDLTAIDYTGGGQAEGIALPAYVAGSTPSGTKPMMAYDAANNRIMVWESGGWADTSSGTGAPASANYLVTSADGTLSDESVFTDGYAIDHTDAGGDGGAFTVSFDPTEVSADGSDTWSDGTQAAIVWTFDVSGTDTTLTFGNGVATFSHALTSTGLLTASAGISVASGQNIAIGADPADAGALRLSNAEYIMSEAAPAGTDISVIGVDAGEVVQIGASGASGVTITPALTITGGIASIGGASDLSGANVTLGTVVGTITMASATSVAYLADSIKDTDIDWGTGAGQVSLDDVTDGSTYQRVAATDVDSNSHVAVIQDSDGTGSITVTGLSTARAITLVDAAQTLANLSSNQTFAGTSTFNGAVTMAAQFNINSQTIASTGNITMKLGDAAGSNKLSLTDSADAEVASIDSDGTLTAVAISTVRTGDPQSMYIYEGEGGGNDYRGFVAQNFSTSLLYQFPDSEPSANDIMIFGAPSAGVSAMSHASFSTDNFLVSGGLVTIKDLGVSVAEINATGTPSGSTVLYGDGSWGAVSASAGGSDTQMQYNSSGSLAGEAALTYDATTNTLHIIQAGSNLSLKIDDGTYSPNHTPQVAFEGAVEIDGTLFTDNGITSAANITATAFVPTTAANAVGEIGFATNAFSLYASSEDMTITAGSDLWTFASGTSATFAFTPAVGFTGAVTLTGGVASLGAAADLSGATVTLGTIAGTLSDGTASWNTSTQALAGFATIAATTSVTAPLYDVSGAAGITFGSADVTAFTFSGQSEDLVWTPSADTWTASSSTGVTEMNFSAFNLVTTGDILGGIHVVTKTADYTVGTDDADEARGTLFINGDNDSQVWTLPSAVANMSMCFFQASGVSGAVTVTPASGDYLLKDGTRGTAATAYTSTGDGGDALCIVAISADDWLITRESGTWSE